MLYMDMLELMTDEEFREWEAFYHMWREQVPKDDSFDKLDAKFVEVKHAWQSMWGLV